MIKATCSNCQQQFSFRNVGYSNRQIEEDIKEIGIECSNCGEWYHAYFLNTELANNRPPQDASRKVRRDYQAKVKRFNRKMRAALGMVKEDGRWVRKGEVENV